MKMPAAKTGGKNGSKKAVAKGGKDITKLKPMKISRTVLQVARDNGLVALDRPYTDPKGWEQRRKREEEPVGGWPTPPKHWPSGVRVDTGRPVWWLPKGWGQGVKLTCTSRLLSFISPEGKCYYHKHVVEQVSGEKFAARDSSTYSNMEWARNQAVKQIKFGKKFDKFAPKIDYEDEELLATLSKKEKSQLPKSADDLHFAVISARRTEDYDGLRGIVGVQAELVAGGAKPVWYVDQASVTAYRDLGLNAKVGGKLVPARNMALDDAAKLGKPCVQISDDIRRWDFFLGEMCSQVDLAAGNEAAKNADHFRISPAAAARFLVAKLRGASAGTPKLAGVFPLGNRGQAFSREAISTNHFILGDFFVTENSPCRFDTRMSLKEDYDFTCTHLAKHGSVVRCNRIIVAAVHETNAGGAVSLRDDSGNKERENIRVLQKKWPGVFSINGARGDTQVVMSWRRRKV